MENGSETPRASFDLAISCEDAWQRLRSSNTAAIFLIGLSLALPGIASATAIAQTLIGDGAVTLTGLPGDSCKFFNQGGLMVRATEFATSNVLNFGPSGCEQSGDELSLLYESVLATSTAYAGDLTTLSPAPETFLAVGSARPQAAPEGESQFFFFGQAGDEITFEISFVYSLLASVDGMNPPESPPYVTLFEIATSQVGYWLTLVRVLDESPSGGLSVVGSGGVQRAINLYWDRNHQGDLGTETSSGSVSQHGRFVLPLDSYYRLEVERNVTARAVNAQALPEPTSLALLGVGLVILARTRRAKAT